VLKVKSEGLVKVGCFEKKFETPKIFGVQSLQTSFEIVDDSKIFWGLQLFFADQQTFSLMTSKQQTPSQKFIFFWGNQDYCSQWYPVTFSVNEGPKEGGIVTYNCAEMRMMYKKAMLFGDRETATKILQTNDPKTQKALGR
jgi:hypothetical protein